MYPSHPVGATGNPLGPRSRIPPRFLRIQMLVDRSAETQVLVDGYEGLRQSALGGSGSGCPGCGLAILISRGLAAWVEACLRATPSLRAPSSPLGEFKGTLPSGGESEVVYVLAEMALSTFAEAGRCIRRRTRRSRRGT